MVVHQDENYKDTVTTNLLLLGSATDILTHMYIANDHCYQYPLEYNIHPLQFLPQSRMKSIGKVTVCTMKLYNAQNSCVTGNYVKYILWLVAVIPRVKFQGS